MSLKIIPKPATDIYIKLEFLGIQWGVDTRGPQFYKPEQTSVAAFGTIFEISQLISEWTIYEISQCFHKSD
jgi:hypothetical protein